VVATGHLAGLLQLPNRPPLAASGPPVVLVPGRYANALSGGRVAVEFDGRIEPGESANVAATFGPPTTRPILLTTPLSGWFTCAAERGTGIAVLFELVSRLAAEHSLLVVGTSAHELFVNRAPAPKAGQEFGVRAYLAGLDVEPALVVHLGANVALAAREGDTGRLALAPGLKDPDALAPSGRGLFARFDDDSFEQVLAEFAPVDLPAIRNPPQFPGEGELWAAATQAPMISFVGATPFFHTPQDTKENTTNPQALLAVADAITHAVRTFLTATDMP
jgi:hypothetical protein